MINPQTKGMLQVLIGAACISLAPLFVKVVAVGPVVVAFYRMFFSFLILFSWLVIRRLLQDKFEFKLHYIWLCLAGCLFAGDVSMWHNSILLLGPGIATLLVNTQVIILAGFGVLFYKEPCNAKLIVSIIIAFTGLLFISGATNGDISIHLKGVALALLAALAYSMYILLVKNTQVKYKLHDMYIQLLMICFGAVIGTGIIAYLAHESFVITSKSDMFYLVLYAVIVQVVGWAFIVRGLPYISLTQAGLLLLAQPALAYLWDILLFSKQTALIEAIGVVCLFSAIALGSIKMKPKMATIK